MKRVAVVTGGARRIGEAIVRRLHALEFDIALHYWHSTESAQALAAQLNHQRSDSCAVFQADLREVTQVTNLVEAIMQRHSAIDLLVNNASGFETTPIEHCTPAQFDNMLATNLRAPYFLIQGLLPALRQRPSSIVNIIDVHAQRPLPDYNAYCAAKAGLASLTRSLALELAPGIRVNGISPGAILWPEGEGAYDQPLRELTIASTPLQRLGDPTDIAAAVAFLAADAPFITGQVLTIDGGRGLDSD